MYLNILDTFNNLFLKIENFFLRLYSVTFIHSNHLHYSQTIPDKAGDPGNSNRSEIRKKETNTGLKYCTNLRVSS